MYMYLIQGDGHCRSMYCDLPNSMPLLCNWAGQTLWSWTEISMHPNFPGNLGPNALTGPRAVGWLSDEDLVLHL